MEDVSVRLSLIGLAGQSCLQRHVGTTKYISLIKGVCADLPKLDLQVDRGTDFQAWRDQWESYLSLSELDKEHRQTGKGAHSLFLTRDTNNRQQPGPVKGTV